MKINSMAEPLIFPDDENCERVFEWPFTPLSTRLEAELTSRGYTLRDKSVESIGGDLFLSRRYFLHPSLNKFSDKNKVIEYSRAIFFPGRTDKPSPIHDNIKYNNFSPSEVVWNEVEPGILIPKIPREIVLEKLKNPLVGDESIFYFMRDDYVIMQRSNGCKISLDTVPSNDQNLTEFFSSLFNTSKTYTDEEIVNKSLEFLNYTGSQ